MAKIIQGYIKLTYTEGKALLTHFTTNNVAPPRELYQCLAMLEEVFNKKEKPPVVVVATEEEETDHSE